MSTVSETSCRIESAAVPDGPGCVVLTSERVIWTASDARQARQPHGALAVPLHCVANAAQAGGGVLGWGVFGSFEVTFSVQPLYDPGQPPAAVTLAFAGGKDDRDQVFRELTRLLRERPWAQAPPVAAPTPAPAAAAPAPAPAPAPAAPPLDADGIRVQVPLLEKRRARSGAADGPACPARSPFSYDFSAELRVLSQRD